MSNIKFLESKRTALLKCIARIGEFRPGSLSANYRKCGNPSCCCAKDDHPGHAGWQLSRKVKGKSINRGIPARALDATRQQLDEYQRFKKLVSELTEVSESLCDLRLQSERSKKKR